MSLLSMVQQAFSEIGLAQAAGQPASVIGNSDPNVVKAFGLINRSGIILRDAPGAPDYWQQLRRQFLFNLAGQGPFTGTFTYGSNVITNVVFTGSGAGWAALQAGWQVSSRYCLPDTMIATGGINQGGQTITMTQPANTLNGSQFGVQVDTALAFGQEAYPFPNDLNYFIPATDWDRNFRWQLLGPVNAQEWQVLKSGISPVGPRLRYRVMQGAIYVNPSPFIQTGNIAPVTDLIVMEYAAINWVAPAASPTVPSQQLFQADTDVCPIFPEDLLTQALKWRMLKAIGNAYAEEKQEYEDTLQQRQGRETVARSLPLNARAGSLRLLNSQQVPDTGFGT